MPTATGSGGRGVAHKCALLAFSWFLASPPKAGASYLRKFALSFVSQTSDMGSEFSIPDFSCKDPVSLLPAWLQPTTSMPPVNDIIDIDCNSSESEAELENVDGPELLRPPRSPGPCVDIDGPALEQHPEDEPPLPPPFAPPAPPPAPAPAPPPPPLVPEGGLNACGRFLPGALNVPGLQHIANNLASDVHTSLSHWPVFWEQLKSLEAMLHVPERRSRYVWTCVRGTPFAHKDLPVRNQFAFQTAL